MSFREIVSILYVTVCFMATAECDTAPHSEGITATLKLAGRPAGGGGEGHYVLRERHVMGIRRASRADHTDKASVVTSGYSSQTLAGTSSCR